MILNKFGETGDYISALGYGCMRLPEYEKDGQWFIEEDKAIHMIHRAHELGVNYFDTAPLYCNCNSEIAVGKAIKDRRDKLLLSTKLDMDVVSCAADYRKGLENSLRKLDTDYIDYYHFWALNKDKFDNKVMKFDLLNEARKAKEEGLIRHISFSFHDDAEVIRHIIDTAADYGVPMESMLVQYNLLDRKNEEMIKYASDKGMGVVAMGPVGGGRLASPTELYTKLTGKPSIATYELAFKFVLGNHDIDCALSGMSTIDMVEKNAKIGSDESNLSKDEWETLKKSLEQLSKFNELYCTGCGYCQPCPMDIKIPLIFELFTYYNVYGLVDNAKMQFQTYIKNGGKCADDCSDCGMCESQCPQKLKIREELRKVQSILEK